MRAHAKAQTLQFLDDSGMDIEGMLRAKMPCERMKESMSNAASRIFRAVMMLALMIGLTARAEAGVVSGVYTSRAGTPIPEHQLHFQNRVSGDMFLARSSADGSFSADLPPGVYDLRAERGLVVKSNIVVGDLEMNLGQVRESELFFDLVRRPFERQGVAPALVDTAAPATAHIANAAPEGSGTATFWSPGGQKPAAVPPPATH
jgi:hypothetical protein